MKNCDREIKECVEQTWFVDTHEHLIEESQRLSGDLHQFQRSDDWAYLFSAYASNDLAVAGMTDAQLQSFLGPDLPSEAKYRLVAPYWNRIRHTGYAQALRHTFQGLYGEDDLTAESFPRIA